MFQLSMKSGNRHQTAFLQSIETWDCVIKCIFYKLQTIPATLLMFTSCSTFISLAFKFRPQKAFFNEFRHFLQAHFVSLKKTKSGNWSAKIQATKTKLWSNYRFIYKFQPSFLGIWFFPWNLNVVPRNLISKSSVDLPWDGCFRLQPHEFRGSTSNCNQVRAWSSWLWRLPNTQ